MSFPGGPDHTSRVRVRLSGFASHIHAVQIAVAARVEPPRAVQLLRTTISHILLLQTAVKYNQNQQQADSMMQ